MLCCCCANSFVSYLFKSYKRLYSSLLLVKFEVLRRVA